MSHYEIKLLLFEFLKWLIIIFIHFVPLFETSTKQIILLLLSFILAFIIRIISVINCRLIKDICSFILQYLVSYFKFFVKALK